MSEITNFSKEEAIDFLDRVVNDHLLFGEIDDELREDLETAIRIAIAHLKENDTNDVATAIDCIFQMYRRKNDIDKAYRNAARFILSVVDNVPSRYESYDDPRPDLQLPDSINQDPISDQDD